MPDMDSFVSSISDKVKEVLKDDKNKAALAAAVAVYAFSKSDKERNAIVAGLLVFVIATLKDSGKKTNA